MQVQRISGTSNYNTSFAAQLIINGYYCSHSSYLQKCAHDIGSPNDTITIDISSPERWDESWSWNEMGYRCNVTKTRQDIYVKSVIGGEESETRNIGYWTIKDISPSDGAENRIMKYLEELKHKVNTFDTNVVGQNYIDDKTIQFYNKKGDTVSEVTLLGKNLVRIKKTLEDKSKATIIDNPKQTIIKQRNRSDYKDVDITVYKGKLEGQMLITVNGNNIKINNCNDRRVIEADPKFEQVIGSGNKLEKWAYDNYIGPYDVSRYTYDNKIIITEAKNLFEEGDGAWRNCKFFATNCPTESKLVGWEKL